VYPLGLESWYVVYTKPHKEEFAQHHLRAKDLEVFLPRLRFPQSFQKRQRIVSLFPNYLFVRIHFPEQYHYVTWSPGVRRFVSFGATPTPLDENIVEFLMQQADPEGIITARSNLKIGQEILIDGGPFNGIAGIIQEPPDAKGRVKVLMSLLSRQVTVEVRARHIRTGWVAVQA
jgi:transcriptional antiterminator RfaH